VLVTHNPELAARYAQRTVELVDGQIVADQGGPGAVAGRPAAWTGSDAVGQVRR
jgi:ABC-type sulfate/molybdate transport systems ATPase subunit